MDRPSIDRIADYANKNMDEVISQHLPTLTTLIAQRTMPPARIELMP
jgi:hypothetical protein